LVNVPTGQVHGYSFKPGTQGWVVTFATELLDQLLMSSEGLGRALSQPALIRGTRNVRDLMTAIFEEYGAREYARAHILRGLSATLLGRVARAIAESAKISWHAPSNDLVKRFEALVDEHFTEHWPVTCYADVLKVTPTHLSRLTREAYGCSASSLIRDRIVREARRNLVYTNLPISTIAYTLGFDDPAYFSRIFAGATGSSPSQFRDRMHLS
jgi:AraC family transcriptional activator of pobA